jgi:hypothetical protein
MPAGSRLSGHRNGRLEVNRPKSCRRPGFQNRVLGHPQFVKEQLQILRLGAAVTLPQDDSGEVKCVLPHPSRKNKSAARVGHPGRAGLRLENQVRAIPCPIRRGGGTWGTLNSCFIRILETWATRQKQRGSRVSPTDEDLSWGPAWKPAETMSRRLCVIMNSRSVVWL